MRRTLFISIVFLLILTPSRAYAADQTIHITGGSPSPADVTINGGDKVTWINDDVSSHKLYIDGEFVKDIAYKDSFSHTFPDPGSADATVTYTIDSASGTGGTITVKAATTTTTSTTEPTTTTTTAPTTTTSTSTSTSTSSTTTTSTSTTTTLFSSTSNSGQVTLGDKGSTGGSSSALPLLIGAVVVVAGLAGLAYWFWIRSGEPYDEGPDWTQEPPPTVQGPRI